MKETTTQPTKKESAKAFLKELIKDIIIALAFVRQYHSVYKPEIAQAQQKQKNQTQKAAARLHLLTEG